MSLWALSVCFLAASPDAGAVTKASSLLPDGGVTWAGAMVRRTEATAFARELLEDGWHVRFGTAGAGPVHVWWPRHYRRDSATVVIYLHGYTTDVDAAFLDHKLAAKFRDSGKNALFIVPQAPSWRTDPVYWTSLEELLLKVALAIDVKVPTSPATVVGHSGAYRTVTAWLAQGPLSRLILLDALYAGEDELHAWLALADGKVRQLVLVGIETAARTEGFLARYPTATRLPEVPYLFDALSPAQAKAAVLYLPTDRFDHMGLVEDSRLLPWLLRTF